MNKENKLKNFYEKEINNVKRHYSSMLSCGDIQAKKTISRLQSQLKLKKENKENLMESKNLLFPFDENKKIDGDAKKEKEYEIKNLKKRIEQLEHEKNENLYDKTIYMEGSYWMSILFLSENFNEFLLKVKKVMKESNLIHTFLNQLETVFKKKLEEIINSISIKEKIDEKNEIFNYYEWIIVTLKSL